MGAELELNGGVVKLKLNLIELAAGIKGLAGAAIGANERENARQAIKKLIDEVDKTLAMVVEQLGPLYKLTTKERFLAGFEDARGEIKRIYLNRATIQLASCEHVKDALAKLNEKRDWMQRVPGADAAYKRVDDACQDWLTHDDEIVRFTEGFLDVLNRFADDIGRLKQHDPGVAMDTLNRGLSLLEPNFIVIKTTFADFKRLSGEL